MGDGVSSTSGYALQAPSLFERYEKRASERVHAAVLRWFPAVPSRVLDIGAGTGRDAAYFAAKGQSVLAVEPVAELREGAARLHPEPSIEWLEDRLPLLTRVTARGERFDAIMMNAVWMHFDEAERAAGMANIAALMKPGARLFMTQRHGPVPEGRRMFDVRGDETVALAALQDLRCLFHTRTGSIQPENQARKIEWTKLVFEKV